MTEFGTLHAISCRGPQDCSCRPISIGVPKPAPRPVRPPTPLRSRRKRDPVQSDDYDYVVARDGYGCVAPDLGAKDGCADRWGQPLIFNGQFTSDQITLDHVRSEPMMGKRAPSDRRHLVALCWHHHLGGWATSHRPKLRDYLRMVEPA